MLPYQNQQVGGAGGGPIVKDKMHFFGSYQDEREPATLVTAPAQLQIANAAPISFQVPFKNTQKSFLGRFDDQLATNDRLTIRGSRWDWDNPFVLGAGAHPSNAYISTQNATNIVGIWNKVMSGNKVQELRIGYNGFNWTRNPLAGLENGIEYNFVNLIIGGPYNYPQLFHQNNLEARYDMNWHRGAHDLKLGGEYLQVKHTGDVVHPAARPAHLQLESDGGDAQRAVPRGRLERPVEVESRGHRDVGRGRQQVRSELPSRRMGDRHPAADLRPLVRRHLAPEQPAHDQLRRPLGR